MHYFGSSGTLSRLIVILLVNLSLLFAHSVWPLAWVYGKVDRHKEERRHQGELTGERFTLPVYCHSKVSFLPFLMRCMNAYELKPLHLHTTSISFDFLSTFSKTFLCSKWNQKRMINDVYVLTSSHKNRLSSLSGSKASSYFLVLGSFALTSIATPLNTIHPSEYALIYSCIKVIDERCKEEIHFSTSHLSFLAFLLSWQTNRASVFYWMSWYGRDGNGFTYIYESHLVGERRSISSVFCCSYYSPPSWLSGQAEVRPSCSRWAWQPAAQRHGGS